jgi:hypothetical protein
MIVIKFRQFVVLIVRNEAVNFGRPKSSLFAVVEDCDPLSVCEEIRAAPSYRFFRLYGKFMAKEIEKTEVMKLMCRMQIMSSVGSLWSSGQSSWLQI